MISAMSPLFRRVCASIALACFALPAASSAIPNAVDSSPVPDAALQGAALRAALQGGGHVIYFRHTATDFSKSDAGMRSVDDCENQRLLNDAGKADAARIGAQIRALRLPVDEVLASPYCRTMDHARRMMGRAEPRLVVREAQAGDYQGLKQLLAAPVPSGSNRWIVGHGIPFRAVAGPPHLAEGEAVVIKPGGTGWTVVARLRVDDWAALSAAR